MKDRQEADRRHIYWLLSVTGIIATVLGFFGFQNYRATLDNLVTDKFRDKEIAFLLDRETKKIADQMKGEAKNLVAEQVRSAFLDEVKNAVEIEFRRKAPEIRRIIDQQAKVVIDERNKDRSISDEQLSQLADWMKAEQIGLSINFALDNAEANRFGRRLDGFFRGKLPGFSGGGTTSCPGRGVMVGCGNGVDCQRLIRVFAANGIATSQSPSPSSRHIQLLVCEK